MAVRRRRNVTGARRRKICGLNTEVDGGNKSMKIGKKEFDLENHCYVMGILNVTPDSFL